LTSTLHDHIFRRLASTGADQQPWSLLVVTALDSPQALRSYLDGTRQVARPAPSVTTGAAPEGPTPEPPGVYLGAITVAGFRSLGPSNMLPANQASPKAWRCSSPASACAGRPRQGVEAGLGQPASAARHAEATDLVNRCDEAQTYEARLAAGTLPK